MRKVNIVALIATMLLALGACSKESTSLSQPLEESTQYPPSSGVLLEGDVEIIQPNAEEQSEGRVLLTPGEKVALSYTAGSTKQVHLLYKKGTQTATGVGTLTFATSTTGKSNQGTLSANIPAGFVPTAQEPVTVSGIFGGGISAITPQGQVTVSGQAEQFIPAGTTQQALAQLDYDLPMYFLDRPIQVVGNNRSTFSGKFTLFGSLIEVRLVNKFIKDFHPHWMQLTTEVIDFAGSLNLAQSSDPTLGWSTTESKVQNPNADDTSKPLDGKRFSFPDNSLSLKSLEESRLYIWGVGNGKTGSVRLTIGEIPYEDEVSPKAQTQFIAQVQSKKALEQGKVYPLPKEPLPLQGGLIITEIRNSFVTNGIYRAVAIANPNTTEVDLSDYYFVRMHYRGGLGIPDAQRPNVRLLMSLNHPTETMIPNKDSEGTNGIAPEVRTHINKAPTHMLKGGGVIILSTAFYQSGAEHAGLYTFADVSYVIGRPPLSTPQYTTNPLADGELQDPPNGGVFFILKGLPNKTAPTYPFEADMSNVVDNHGLFSSGSLQYSDLSKLNNYAAMGDIFVTRRTDRSMSSPNQLRGNYRNLTSGGRPSISLAGAYPNMAFPEQVKSAPGSTYWVRGTDVAVNWMQRFGSRGMPEPQQ